MELKGNRRHERLAAAVKASDEMLQPFRTTRRMNWERITNTYMPASAAEPHRAQTPVNLMEMALTTYRTRLVARAPRVMAKPRTLSLRAEAKELEIATEMLISEINLVETIRDVVDEAMLSMGIAKVGLTHPEHDEMLGYTHDGGQPFADPVMLDDFVFDPSARRWEHSEWFGDRYRVPLDLVRQSPLLDKGRLDKVGAATQRNPAGTDAGSRTDMQSGLVPGQTPGDTELEEHVWLMDVYLTREQKVETYLWDGGVQGKPLWVVEWEGPEHGPYHTLSFGSIPGTLLPYPPGAGWSAMHDAVNALWRKLIQQALRQKSIMPVRGEQQDDAEKINRAADGAAVGVGSRDLPEERRFGGPDNQVIGITATMMQLFNRSAGNLDALGGLGPSSGTVGQDRIINEQANERLRDMQSRLHRFVKGIVGALADMEYADPFKERVLTKKVGVVEIESLYGPERREADFREFNIDIVPYSMEDQTPSERASMLREVMGELIQLQPMLEQRGVSLRVEEYIKSLGELIDEPALMESLVEYAEPMAEGPSTKARGVPPPNTTTRRYERISRAGASARSPEDEMMAMAQAGGQ